MDLANWISTPTIHEPVTEVHRVMTVIERVPGGSAFLFVATLLN
jgi:hypothetical protein